MTPIEQKKKKLEIKAKSNNKESKFYDYGFLQGFNLGVEMARKEFLEILDKNNVPCSNEQNIGWHNCLCFLEEELKKSLGEKDG